MEKAHFFFVEKYFGKKEFRKRFFFIKKEDFGKLEPFLKKKKHWHFSFFYLKRSTWKSLILLLLKNIFGKKEFRKRIFFLKKEDFGKLEPFLLKKVRISFFFFNLKSI